MFVFSLHVAGPVRTIHAVPFPWPVSMHIHKPKYPTQLCSLYHRGHPNPMFNLSIWRHYVHSKQATTSFSTDRNRKYTISLLSSRSATRAESTDTLTQTHRTPLSIPFRYTGVAASCRSLSRLASLFQASSCWHLEPFTSDPAAAVAASFVPRRRPHKVRN